MKSPSSLNSRPGILDSFQSETTSAILTLRSSREVTDQIAMVFSHPVDGSSDVVA